MKYNEAIDMILDGGRARCKSFRDSTIFLLFGHSGTLIWSNGAYFHLDKTNTTRTDWIVEKDGVVYEEYHPFVGKKDWFKTFSEDVSCPHCHSKDLIKVMIKDIESALYTCTKCQWQGMFVEPHQIIADEVNEDWLEKKVFCLIKKHSREVWAPKQVLGTCCNAACPFCFPEDKPKEEPREKVTVDSLEELINICVRGVTYWEDVNNPVEERRRSLSMAREAREEIMKKLEYLVSLQERQYD